jgi:hypothetical protein
LSHFCLRPDSKARPRKTYLTSPPPTLLNFRKCQMTQNMNDRNWHEWHELTWMTWIDMNYMNL